MKNGLYQAFFNTPNGKGRGLVTLADGHIWGGDVIIYYEGTFEISGGNIAAQVRTDRYANEVGFGPLFGRDVVNLELSGTTDGNQANLTGSAKEFPGVTISIDLVPVATS